MEGLRCIAIFVWCFMLRSMGVAAQSPGELFELEANREVDYIYESTDGVFQAVIDSPQYPENITSVNMTTVIFTNRARSGPVWINVLRVPKVISQLQGDSCGFEIQSSRSTWLDLNIKCANSDPRNSWNVAWPSMRSLAIHLPVSTASVAGAFRIYLTVYEDVASVDHSSGSGLGLTSEIPGYVASHSTFDLPLQNFGNHPEDAKYILKLKISPTASNLIINYLNVNVSESALLSVQNGNVLLYQSSAGYDTPIASTFDITSDFNSIVFSLSIGEMPTYAVFLLKYQVLACHDLPNAVVTRRDDARSSFIVGCDGGINYTLLCANGVWSPEPPRCANLGVSSTKASTSDADGVTSITTESTNQVTIQTSDGVIAEQSKHKSTGTGVIIALTVICILLLIVLIGVIVVYRVSPTGMIRRIADCKKKHTKQQPNVTTCTTTTHPAQVSYENVPDGANNLKNAQPNHAYENSQPNGAANGQVNYENSQTIASASGKVSYENSQTFQGPNGEPNGEVSYVELRASAEHEYVDVGKGKVRR